NLLTSAYSLDPSPFLGARSIVAKAEAGQADEAAREAERLALLYPKNRDARMLHAQILVARGKLDEAAAQLTKVVKGAPPEEGPYALLAEVQARRGKRKEALAVARQLTRNKPQSVVAWSILARLCLLDGAKKEMLDAAYKAWMIKSSPDVSLLYAIALELNGKTKEAVRMYESAYRAASSPEQLTAKLVDLYRQTGDLQEALRVLSDLKRGDGSGLTQGLEIQRIAILWELKRDDEALSALEKLNASGQRSDLVLTLLGYGYERVKRPAEALATYEKVSRDFSLHKDVQVRRILLTKELGKPDVARTMLTPILEQTDPGWQFFALAIELDADAGKLSEAIALSDKAFEKYPDQTRFMFLRAAYQEKAGDVDGSMKTMRKVIEREPENSSALNFLGYLMVDTGGDLAEAKILIERALKIRPGDPAYLDSLGWCYFKLGDIDRAEKLLMDALSKTPEEGVTMEHLGEVAMVRKQRLKAIEWFEKALKQKLDQRDRDRIEKRLDGIKQGS
ncbi:MAG: hypothetical protein RIQ81_947, partial [Pseudomonadota bacterium]